MSTIAPNADSLQRFIFEDADIRGEITHLNQSFNTIMQQHNYPQPVQLLLGEALSTAVLLCATLKFKGQLTLQFQSDGIIKMLVAKCNDLFEIRGLAQFDIEALAKDMSSTELLGEGQLVVTIQSDERPEPYQSIIPLEKQGIARSVELYFAQSEQLATKLWLAVSPDHAVGMLLQLLPERSSREREHFWEYAVKLGETIKNNELLELDNLTILRRLYHEEDIRLFEPHTIQFKCNCNRSKMANAVRLLGKTDAEELLSDKQYINVTCEFCNSHYNFDKVDVAEIFYEEKK